jgi:alpha-galactosidase
MTRLDAFTLNLLSSDEVIAVNQDALGKQAVQIAESGESVSVSRPNRPDQKYTLKPIQIWARPLEDGSLAVGLFNAGEQEAVVTANWADLKLSGKQTVRDLWRQKDLGQFEDKFEMSVAPHGAELIKIFK